MGLELNRIEEPFVFELRNEEGVICGIDANPTIGGKGKGFRPMELLTGSLAGCASIDILLILKNPTYQRLVIVGPEFVQLLLHDPIPLTFHI